MTQKPIIDIYLNHEQIHIWDEELPAMFRDDTFNPALELETYGIAVSNLAACHAIHQVIQWLSERNLRALPDEFIIPLKEYLELSSKDWQALKELVKE